MIAFTQIKLSLFMIILCFSFTSFAQFKLNGKIVNYTGKEALKINIPLVFGFYAINSTAIPIAKDGSFTINLPIQQQKFANLIFQRKFYTLLLNTHKNLSISINEKDSTLKVLGGTALAENKIMQLIDLNEYPFFLIDDGNNKFKHLNLKELNAQVLLPYFAQRDEKIKKVQSSTIATKDKQLIAAEIKYIAYNYLNDLARTQIANKATVDSLIIDIFSKSNPKPSYFPAGPEYYAYIDNYVRFLETKAFIQIKAEKIPASSPIPYFAISLDSANSIVKKYGKPYWRWIGATHNLEPKVVETYTYQQLIALYYNKDLRPFEGLAEAFKQQFPNSNYIPDISKKTTELRSILAQNENNELIKIIPNYQKINSIYDVVKAFKGKVIYLDVWGTWCGPCKEELYYLPELKDKFKDKPVAFVYLDMDEESKDAEWREFIKVNALTGTHLRKNRETIAPFWKELLVDAEDKAEYYPQYFIFDQEGNLVVTKAKRPSSKEELYQQLNKVIK